MDDTTSAAVAAAAMYRRARSNRDHFTAVAAGSTGRLALQARGRALAAEHIMTAAADAYEQAVTPALVAAGCTMVEILDAVTSALTAASPVDAVRVRHS